MVSSHDLGWEREVEKVFEFLTSYLQVKLFFLVILVQINSLI